MNESQNQNGFMKLHICLSYRVIFKLVPRQSCLTGTYLTASNGIWILDVRIFSRTACASVRGGGGRGECFNILRLCLNNKAWEFINRKVPKPLFKLK
jgi:hypothetical protein